MSEKEELKPSPLTQRGLPKNVVVTKLSTLFGAPNQYFVNDQKVSEEEFQHYQKNLYRGMPKLDTKDNQIILKQDENIIWPSDFTGIVIVKDGETIFSRRWIVNGLIHRDNDLPAVEYASGTSLWYKHGKLHREDDGPAVYSQTETEWWVNGQRHREDNLPAVIVNSIKKEYWLNGQRHRTNGPAIINNDSKTNKYFVNGVEIKEEALGLFHQYEKTDNESDWNLDDCTYEGISAEQLKHRPQFTGGVLYSIDQPFVWYGNGNKLTSKTTLLDFLVMKKYNAFGNVFTPLGSHDTTTYLKPGELGIGKNCTTCLIDRYGNKRFYKDGKLYHTIIQPKMGTSMNLEMPTTKEELETKKENTPMNTESPKETISETKVTDTIKPSPSNNFAKLKIPENASVEFKQEALNLLLNDANSPLGFKLYSEVSENFTGITQDPIFNIIKWYKDGKLHRLDGPAIENKSKNYAAYYISDNQYSDVELWKKVASVFLKEEQEKKTTKPLKSSILSTWKEVEDLQKGMSPEEIKNPNCQKIYPADALTPEQAEYFIYGKRCTKEVWEKACELYPVNPPESTSQKVMISTWNQAQEEIKNNPKQWDLSLDSDGTFRFNGKTCTQEVFMLLEHEFATVKNNGDVIQNPLSGNEVPTVDIKFLKLKAIDTIPAWFTGKIEWENGDTHWSLNGYLHRENDLPAVIHANGTKEWWFHGKRHRGNHFPAIEYSNGTKEWYENGKRHRLDGPAFKKGSQAYYYINGVEYFEVSQWKEIADLLLEKRKNNIGTPDVKVGTKIEFPDNTEIMEQLPEPLKPTPLTKKDIAFNSLKREGKEAAKRVAVSKLINFTQTQLIAMNTAGLKNKNEIKKVASTMKSYFETKAGKVTVALAIGGLLPMIQDYLPEKTHGIIEAVGAECRIQGMETVGNELIGFLTGPGLNALKGFASKLSSDDITEILNDPEIRRVAIDGTSSSPSKKKKEAEVIELDEMDQVLISARTK